MFILASEIVHHGDYTIYSGGHLRTPPGMAQKKGGFGSGDGKVAGLRTKGHFLTLITGKGNNTKSSSKLIYQISVTFTLDDRIGAL